MYFGFIKHIGLAFILLRFIQLVINIQLKMVINKQFKLVINKLLAFMLQMVITSNGNHFIEFNEFMIIIIYQLNFEFNLP